MGAVDRWSDPWLRTIGSLATFSDPSARGGDARIAKLFRGRTPSSGTIVRRLQAHSAISLPPRKRRSAIIRIVERPTNSTLIVHWSDPGKCLYGYQIWRRARADRNGNCALSGQPIQKKDEIFRPWWNEYEPQNSDAMILGSVVHRMSATSDSDDVE